MVPTPKYDIGHKVWVARAERVRTSIPCPDCLGTKEWKATTPAGEEFHISCNTCQYGYQILGTIAVYKPHGYALQMTIGSVRIDTNSGDRHPVSYMCDETGVGTGSIYYESDLFEDEKSATRWATYEAQKRHDQLEAKEAEGLEKQRKRDARKPSWDKREVRRLTKENKALAKRVKERVRRMVRNIPSFDDPIEDPYDDTAKET